MLESKTVFGAAGYAGPCIQLGVFLLMKQLA